MRSYMRFRAQFVEGSMTNGTVEAPAIGQNILEFFHDALAHSLDYRHSLSANEVGLELCVPDGCTLACTA